jgi:polar amino acid transport system substrate-binding protein
MPRFAHLFLALLAAISVTSDARAQQVVKVGGYYFSPYVEIDRSNIASGLTLDFIQELNRHQKDFRFEFTVTSPSRRYKDFEEGKFDAIFFETADWGWRQKGMQIEASKVLVEGGDLYIALNKPGRGQEFFADFSKKRIAGILGFHFAFANFESDPKALAAKFDIALVNDNASLVDLILKERRDVAMVTDAYMFRYFKQNPAMKERLMLSQRYDQRHSLPLLLRKGGPVDVARMNGYLEAMERDGTLLRLLQNYGIKEG